MKILFVHNREHPFNLDVPFKGNCGGAALTNVAVLQEGVRRGHDIQITHRKGGRFMDVKLGHFDAAILSHLPGFPNNWVREVATSMPYVRWDHQYDYCRRIDEHNPKRCSLNKCAGCKIGFNREIAASARLRVWQSPVHMKWSLGVLGLPKGRDHILHPPIDTRHFNAKGDDTRSDNLVIYVGSINPLKGIYNVVEWFKKQPKSTKVLVVGDTRSKWEGKDWFLRHKRVTVIRGRKNYQMPKEYRKARRAIHLPAWHEPSSRSATEAYLCGCDLLLNNKVGIKSFDGWKLDGSSDDRRRVRSDCARSPKRFWEKVEEALV